MLLTLKPASQNGTSSPHAYPSPKIRSSKTYSPTPSASSSTTLPPLPDIEPRKMSTPHRGLPPPLGMTLPAVDRGPPPPPPPPPPSQQHMGSLPAPPNQWQGTEESMRNWLAAKAEEDKRKQEEEKTRQETLRLEQRKVEQSILRESLQGGVPPYMVPMVFAGMGGATLANASLEWAQHYFQQMTLQQQQPPPPPPPPQPQVQYQGQQQQQQQQQHQQPPPLPALPPSQGSPDMRRDRAGGPGTNPYAQHPIPNPPSSAGSQGAFGYDRNRQQQILQAAPPPTSAPRGAGQSALARLTTNEMQIQPPPPGGSQVPLQPHPVPPLPSSSQPEHQSSPALPQGPGPQQQQPQPQQPQQQPSQQPQNTPTSIYFHHWVPPNTSKEPPTPSTRSTHGSPYSQNAASHLRSEYANSPKKRKTNAGEAASTKAPPTSALDSLAMAGSNRRRGQSIQNSAGSEGPPHMDDGHPRQPSTSEGESGGTRSGRHGSAPSETRLSRHASPAQEGGTPKREAEGPP